MADFSLQELHDRIEADPNSIGYKNPDTTWKGDQVIADLANAKNFTIDAVSVPMEEVRAATTYAAYDGLGLDEQEWLVWMTPNSGNFVVTVDMKERLSGRLLTVNGVPGTGTDGDSFWALADNAIASVMLALIEVPGSDAEIAWGQNTTITAGQVGRAANL